MPSTATRVEAFSATAEPTAGPIVKANSTRTASRENAARRRCGATSTASDWRTTVNAGTFSRPATSDATSRPV